MGDFLQTYFIDPIRYGTGYNIVNTIVFAIILIIAAVLVYKLLRKMKVTIDKKFLLSIIPFIALGGILRAYEDYLEASGIARNILLITPLVYVTIFVSALALLVISKAVEKYAGVKYWRTWFAAGLFIDAFILSQFRVTNTFGLVAMVGIAAFIIILITAAKKIPSDKIKNFFTAENILVLDVHMFDATTTFVSLSYFDYFEQHVVPGFLINATGPWIMFVLKFAVVSVVLYLFDKELNKKEDAEKKMFLKIIVLILGLGPGLRNFLRLIMGV
ncbi:DUF63 family protein [archaeon]|nr:DUF63 family protein [archaeon]